MADEPATPTVGPNEWLVDEMYDQYRADPTSVSPSWQEFFADYRPGASTSAPARVETPGSPAHPTAPAAAPPTTNGRDTPGSSAPAPAAEAEPADETPADATPIRGAAARIVANMEA
ncbi:MAG: hypothetical protein KDB35_14705, partial [Acidimicrobiales bacterium]|nr:hypothetical protein [Acidimicrobiales bacterium]